MGNRGVGAGFQKFLFYGGGGEILVTFYDDARVALGN